MTKKVISDSSTSKNEIPETLPTEATDESIKQAIADLAEDRFETLQTALLEGNKFFRNVDYRLKLLEKGHGTLQEGQTEITTKQEEIKSDTAELLELMKTARMGTRILIGLGRMLMWLSKVAIGGATLYGLFQWMRTGEIPKFLTIFGIKGVD